MKSLKKYKDGTPKDENLYSDNLPTMPAPSMDAYTLNRDSALAYNYSQEQLKNALAEKGRFMSTFDASPVTEYYTPEEKEQILAGWREGNINKLGQLSGSGLPKNIGGGWVHPHIAPSASYNVSDLFTDESTNYLYNAPKVRMLPPSEDFPNTSEGEYNRKITKMPPKKTKGEKYKEDIQAKGGNPDYQASIREARAKGDIAKMPTKNYTQDRIGDVLEGRKEDKNVKLTSLAKEQGPSGAGAKSSFATINKPNEARYSYL
jgi:hypothetical protein